MSNDAMWDKKYYNAFVEEGILTERQKEILRTRIEGYSIARQSHEMSLSIDMINKEISEMRKKYDEAQKYSDILPPRKTNKKNLLQEENNTTKINN